MDENSEKTVRKVMKNPDWWLDQLNLVILRQHSTKLDPMDEDFNYVKNSKVSTSRP